MELRDQAQRTQIEHELERNLLVEASAGSGKTHSITRRMIHGLLEGVYRPQEMAAVTFTNKAAAELRGRLRIALEEEFRQDVEPEVRVRLQFALDNLDLMFLGTIHSFCGRLLREYPVQAGISPGFREIEDQENAALQQVAFERCLEEQAGRELLPVLAESGLAPSNLIPALTTVCDNGDAAFPGDAVEKPDAEARWAELTRFAPELASLVPEPLDPQSKCKLQECADKFAQRWRSAEHNTRTLLDLLAMWESASIKPTPKWWGAR